LVNKGKPEQHCFQVFVRFGHRLHREKVIVTVLKDERRNRTWGRERLQPTQPQGLPVDPLGVGEPVHRYPQLGEGLLDDPRSTRLWPLDEHRAVGNPARQHAHHGLFVLADAADSLEIADQCPGLLYVQKLGVHGNHTLTDSKRHGRQSNVIASGRAL
jgi:hypothetical protein